MKQMICENLRISYDSKVVIENLSFVVNEGDYLCIIGENGSGKTTLMKTMLGLHEPDSGSVSLINGLSRVQIGYLPQQKAAQRDFPASVMEITLSGCQSRRGIRPFYNKEERKMAADSLARMGILNLSKRCYGELSGGQQQRVLLARALCAAQKMIFLDEPIAGLDPKAVADMYDVIAELNKGGMTIVMISHDETITDSFASRVLYLDNKGRGIERKLKKRKGAN